MPDPPADEAECGGAFVQRCGLSDEASLVGRIANAPRWFRIAACLLQLALVALLDDLTGGELSFSVFYLVPVLSAGVFVSRNLGCVMAFVGAALWGHLDLLARDYSADWIPVWNAGVRLIFFLVINELVHVTRTAHIRERRLSRMDSLTGTANGRAFAERVEQEVVGSRRCARPFTIAYADIDRFKHFNDARGHAEGDRLLRVVARTLGRELRAVDMVARLGGDEFGLLLTSTEAAAARTTLARIAKSLNRDAGEHWGVGATIGAVTFERPPADVESAVRVADHLMYRGKYHERVTILQRVWPADFDEEKHR
jgi:diguanylate cyclase (GGDEF)-like protein